MKAVHADCSHSLRFIGTNDIQRMIYSFISFALRPAQEYIIYTTADKPQETRKEGKELTYL